MSSELYGTDLSFTYDGATSDIYSDTSDIATINGMENLYQAIQNRLLTEMGSLRLHPTYGSRLKTLIGKGSNTITQMLVKMMVTESLQYEQRIALIQNIDVSFNRTSQIMYISVEIISVYSTQINVQLSVGG
jgi:phage baseplate assembly protein W